MMPSILRLLTHGREPPANLLQAFANSPHRPARDMAVLWDQMHALMHGLEPESTSKQLDILSLACGRCTEALPFAAWWQRTAAARRVHLFGMDIRGQELERARRRIAAAERFVAPHRPGGEPGFRARFVEGDGSQLTQRTELPPAFDIVLLRHQNAWNHVRLWTEIFAQGLQCIRPGGLLLITSYFDREHAMALNMMQGLGARLLRTQRNTLARNLATPGKSVDRHLAVFAPPRETPDQAPGFISINTAANKP